MIKAENQELSMNQLYEFNNLLQSILGNIEIKLIIDELYLFSMNGISSFYSFKQTETNSHRPVRKDRCSHFQDFQKLRLQQQKKISGREKRKKAVSYSVLVRSEEQKQLLSFLKLPNIPTIKMKGGNKKGSGEKKKNKSKSKDNTPLDTILGNKPRFMRTYFRSLRDVKDAGGASEEIRHVFEEVKVRQWRIKGYLKGDYLILRAVHESGRERYLKYKYEKYIASIKTNYEQFVKDVLEQQMLSTYDV